MRHHIFNIALLVIMALPQSLYAGISVCEGENGRIHHIDPSGDAIPGCYFYDEGQNATSEQCDEIKRLNREVPLKYLEMKNGLPVEKDQHGKDQVDQQLSTAEEVKKKIEWNAMVESLKSEIDNPSTPTAILLNEVMKEVTDEIRAIKDGSPKPGRDDSALREAVKGRLEVLKK